MNLKGPQEELSELLPQTGQTLEEDIFMSVAEISAKNISTNNLISVEADGASSMRGAQKRFVTLLKKSLDHNIMLIQCMAHPETLVHMLPAEFNEVMAVTIQTINKIMAKGLNCRQFCELLDDGNSTYSGFLMHNEVRWLSKVEVLKHLAACLEHGEGFFVGKTSAQNYTFFYFLCLRAISLCVV